jgi:two-component system cell cycle sensor histidine kinase/response regulator CckA
MGHESMDELQGTLLELEEQVKLLVKTEMRLRRTQAELLAAKETIEEYSRTLEEKVEERTAELGHAYEQLNQASKMAAIGTLSGGIAHDFNNLLSAILGNAELLTLDLPPHSEQARLAETIASAARRGSELTARLLSFAGAAPLSARSVNLNNTIQEVVSLLGHTIEKTIAVEVALASDLAIVHGDQIQIYQAVLNICINAKEAMLPRGGGTLRIETHNRELSSDDGHIGGHARSGRFAVISISDTGIGMDDETIERIFDPFFTTGDRSMGKGLGLSITYRIVTSHDGFISVSSKEGRGTCFNIYLPACEDDAAARPVSEEEELAVSGEGTILIADDLADIRNLATSILERFGYRTLTAEDGKETVEIYEQHRDEIAMVVLDLIMPGWSGEKTLEALKSINPEIKVLISSGYSTESANEKLLALGIDGFLQKPFTIAELLAEVRRVLSGNRAE